MLPLCPAYCPVRLDLDGVDSYGDCSLRIPKVLVRVRVQAEALLPEARVVAGWEMGNEPVETAGEAFELVLGHQGIR